jgi:hypothetical protein
MRLNQPEEDGAIYLYAFATEAIYLLFPFVKELWNLGFQDALPAVKRQKLMAYYRSCLQRQIYANGNGRDADKVDAIMRCRRVPQKGIPGCAVHHYHA